jgi:hypothetical protein
VFVSRIGWRTLVGSFARDGAQAVVGRAPQAQPVADQAAEGEQEYVEPF